MVITPLWECANASSNLLLLLLQHPALSMCLAQQEGSSGQHQWEVDETEFVNRNISTYFSALFLNRWRIIMWIMNLAWGEETPGIPWEWCFSSTLLLLTMGHTEDGGCSAEPVSLWVPHPFKECQLSDHIPSVPKQALLLFVENHQQNMVQLLPIASVCHLPADLSPLHSSGRRSYLWSAQCRDTMIAMSWSPAPPVGWTQVAADNSLSTSFSVSQVWGNH